ncbi:hypothetical protein A5724_02760 [Mycobacterium sp. ACS1612]|uniref:FAD-dependent oxidoreductase n=1 Tax=Mycobacterium sp. ACS1612 TaxID=1834117 RepID=UPI000800F0B5|nr:hypothetical protein [Mycobacterium sp. ACS1612]OBF26997.1 hypothetical protein A5724_02760 [Mycobacterium sp. ACS1612]
MADRPSVLIVGAGIGGLTAAIALRARGIPSRSAAPAPRTSGTALANNTTAVLRALGIRIGLGDAETGSPIVCVNRDNLMATLRDACGDTPIHCGTEAVSVDIGGERPAIRCADGRVLSGDVVIGADGVGSVVPAAFVGQDGSRIPFLSKWGRGAVTFLGDTAHAVEDGYVLATALDKNSDPVVALRLYADVRRKRTRMLVGYARRLSRIEQSDSSVVQSVRNHVVSRAPNRILTMQAKTLRLDLEAPV